MNNEDFERRERRQRFRKRLYQLTPAALALYGIIGTIFFAYSKPIEPDSTKYILFIFGGMGVIGAFMVMSNYLTQTRLKNNEDLNNQETKSSLDPQIRRIFDRLDYRYKELQDKITNQSEQLKSQLEKNRQEEKYLSIDDKQRKEIHQKLTESISKNLTTDFFDSIKQSLKLELLDDRKEQIYAVYKRGENSIIRLEREIELLTKRANINLIIGSIITLAALILLGYFVVNEDFNSNEIVKVSLQFIPRLSLVIFIELFSFFFLKLYRSSLSEIKYYQNELTNLELKQTSLQTATTFGNESDISNIISELSKTERNFLLQKGESTVELEKSKVETQGLKDILKSSLDTIVSLKK